MTNPLCHREGRSPVAILTEAENQMTATALIII